MKKNFLEVGRIASFHGIRGAVNIVPWCNSPDFICKFSNLYLGEKKEKLEIEFCYVHKLNVVIKFRNKNTKLDIDNLKDEILYIYRKDVTLEEGEFFLQDIIGIDVLDVETKKRYGKVTDVTKTLANDVYTIVSDDGKSHFLPAVKDVLIDINVNKEFILVKPIGGIFDD
ncbi:MAG: ribosome maturation factor RimM [Oscillospiraceae bacterium]|jgi:16S rRNA processing protein RimM|nr:ribosome maturation factor RimM [Oscillospiraceae bacterium]